MAPTIAGYDPKPIKPPSSVNHALAACLISTSIVAVLAVPYLFAGFFSVMIFDAPGSTERLANWFWFLVAAGYLPLLVVLTITAWVLMGKGAYRWSVRTAITTGVLAVVPAMLFLFFILFE